MNTQRLNLLAWIGLAVGGVMGDGILWRQVFSFSPKEKAPSCRAAAMDLNASVPSFAAGSILWAMANSVE
jgi:hypothetical protein